MNDSWFSMDWLSWKDAVLPVISIFIGGLITWCVSRKYYIRAANDTRKSLNAIFGAVTNPNAKLTPQYDQQGNLIGIVVGAVGSSSGVSTVSGVSGIR